MDALCGKCGSTKIIPGIAIQDQGQYSDGHLQALVGFMKPEAALFRGRTYARLRANICGQCGHVELFAEQPELLYEAYRRTHADKSPPVS